MLTDQEISVVVNQYIGVSGGYLGDFSYRTHEEFYPNFCGLHVDVNSFSGTTRERFTAILKSRSPIDQIKILHGTVRRFSLDKFKDEELPGKKAALTYIQSLIEKLESKRVDVNSVRVGTVINGCYTITDIPQQKGGMSRIFFADDTVNFRRVVLKFCGPDDEEIVSRFKREVRLLQSYLPNPNVIKILDDHLDFTPPFFVMEFADGGDLAGISASIRSDASEQERVFNRMIDCLDVIHGKGHFHRDIKPENFLICNSDIKISDFGLAQDPESTTRMTVTHQWGGTYGYYPPQFFEGGFKNTHASDDIFMIGKTFYSLLSGRDPTYIKSDGIEMPLYRLIEKCVHPERTKRYQNCTELKRSLNDVFNIILHRGNIGSEFQPLKDEVFKKLNSNTLPSDALVKQLLEQLVDQVFEVKKDFIDMCPSNFIFCITKDQAHESVLSRFVDIYGEINDFAFAQSYYPFSYAEGIASDCANFLRGAVNNELKIKMLGFAMEMSYRFHRTKAIEICLQAVYEIQDGELAFLVSELLREKRSVWFLSDLDPAKFRHGLLAKVAADLRQ